MGLPFSKLRPIVLLGLSALVTMPVSAQSPQASDSLSYAKSYWVNGVRLLKAPAHFNKDQWIAVGATTLFAGTSIVFDEPVNATISQWTSDAGNTIGKAGNIIGSGYSNFGVSFAALGIGSLIKDRGLLEFAQDNLQAQVYTTGATLLVKHLAHRARPEAGAGASSWGGPFKSFKNDSYFSGHTSLTFCTASMIYLHSNRRWWVAVASYGVATMVGISRMQMQKHWLSDVVSGAIVGTVTSRFVYMQQQKRRKALSGSRLP